MNALRHGWTSLIQDSTPLAYRYSFSLGAVMIASLSIFAVAVYRFVWKRNVGI